MSLTASMWTGVSGLLTHGEKMNVVGHNIANVNTVGFKSQRMDFQDFIYADSYSASGPVQIGRGVSVEALFGDFSQGSFETTGTVTDLAIGGNGFFKVISPTTNKEYYSRAGNFRFDKEGFLKEPHGYTLQGWPIDNTSSGLALGGSAQPPSKNISPFKGTGLPEDVQLHGFTVEPRRTDSINISAVLTADSGYDKSKSINNPFAALFETWDARNLHMSPPVNPISQDAYASAIPFNVYDEGGTAHLLTVYFDQVTEDPAAGVVLDNLPPGYKIYEYMVTMDPAEDMRRWYDGANDVPLYDPTGINTSKNAGVLMVGTLVFNSSGQLVNQTAYTWCGDSNIDTGELPGSPTASGGGPLPYNADPTDMESWRPTGISNSGFPVFVANFTGVADANTLNSGTDPIVPGSVPVGNKFMIEFDLGLNNLDYANPWISAGDLGGVGFDYSNLALMSSASRHTDAVVNYAGSSSTKYVMKNGYSYGDLLTVRIDQDGVLYATYTNQVTLPLYQIALYDFVNKDGLYREGGNLFSTTLDSGEPSVAPANVGGMGKVNAYSLEQSNVDLAKEFVHMITTQRGFQANGRVITTVDTMLETVISLKR